MLSKLNLPSYGKYKKVIKTICIENKYYSISLFLRVSDETRRLRHIYIKNLLHKHIHQLQNKNINCFQEIWL